MLRWRAAWAAAQPTGVIVSSVVWIMVLGVSRAAAGMVLVLGYSLWRQLPGRMPREELVPHSQPSDEAESAEKNKNGDRA